MQTFNVGDRVKLNSGGPAMTVESVDGTNITCVWFHEHEQKFGVFPAATLAPYTPPQPRSAVVAFRSRRSGF